MTPVDSALATVLGAFTPLPAETVSLAEALGRTLAEPFVAVRDQPPFDNSAMDGYAVRHADVPSPGTTLTCRGESAAGGSPDPVAPSEAMRIFTGAPMPPGADCVILQEDADVAGASVTFRAAPRPGQHVRSRASDFAAGEVLCAAGTRVTPGLLGALASQGLAQVAVRRRPRVAILPTGDELVPPGTELPPGGIYDSNGPMLAALVRGAGGSPSRLLAAPDDPAELDRAIAGALRDSDLLLTTGGVSVGDHDHVKAAIARAGVPLELWKVAVKPGKPLAFGRGPRGAVLGLPGNPVSAFVMFTLFAGPAIRCLSGDPRPAPPRVRALLTAELEHRPGRTELCRGSLRRSGEAWVVDPHPNQGSGAVHTVMANALIVVPAASKGLSAGATVETLLVAPLPGEPRSVPLDTDVLRPSG